MSNYRIRIKSSQGNVSYLVRHKETVSYMSGDETPLALSNFAQGGAAELRFALEDAANGGRAIVVLREFIQKTWPNVATAPIVDLL